MEDQYKYIWRLSGFWEGNRMENAKRTEQSSFHQLEPQRVDNIYGTLEEQDTFKNIWVLGTDSILIPPIGTSTSR